MKKINILLLGLSLLSVHASVTLAGERSAPVPSVITKQYNPNDVVSLALAQRFLTLVEFPEPIEKIFLGDPTRFQVEYADRSLYVKPIVKESAHTDLVVHTKSGEHILLYLRTEEEGKVEYPERPGIHPRQLTYALTYAPKNRSFVVKPKTLNEATGTLYDPERLAPTGERPRPGDRGFENRDKAPRLEELFQENTFYSSVKYEGEILQGAILKVTEENNMVYILFRLKNLSHRVMQLLDPQVLLESHRPKGMLIHRSALGSAEMLPVLGMRLDNKRIEPGATVAGIIAVQKPPALESNQRMVLTVSESLAADKPLRLTTALGRNVLESIP